MSNDASRDEYLKRRKLVGLKFEELVHSLNTLIPAGRDLSVTITNLDTARLWAERAVDNSFGLEVK